VKARVLRSVRLISFSGFKALIVFQQGVRIEAVPSLLSTVTQSGLQQVQPNSVEIF
jgi:hypothetical protein